MYIIRERDCAKKVLIKCSNCEREIKVDHYWVVDNKKTCDDCFELKYSELVQCDGVEEDGTACPHFANEGDFTEGLCDRCWELSEPPAQNV
jgi:hypothetical protein